MTLSLPNVTLVAIDTACHELTRLALEDSMRKISFGDVLVFSDRDLGIGRHLPCHVKNAREAEEWMWYGVAPHLTTTHALYIQWDGWATMPRLWRPDFLSYDYIGAPWPWHTESRVGNGGFSLRSKRLLDLLHERRSLFPFDKPEDDTLCRRYGVTLQIGYGIRFAPEALAEQFSYEHGPSRDSFGFHGLWNFARRLPEEETIRRLGLLPPSYLGPRPDLWNLALAARHYGQLALIKTLENLGISS